MHTRLAGVRPAAQAALLILGAWLGQGPVQAQPLNNGAAVAPAIGAQSGPRVFSFGPTASQVFWTDERSGISGVRGALADTAGSIVLTAPLVDMPGNVPPGFHRLAAAITTTSRPWTVWQDSSSSYDLSISSQYITNGWGATYVQQTICNAVGDQTAPTISGDANSAIAAWQDARLGAANTDIYALLVWGPQSPPPVTWPVNGVQLCNATGNQLTPAACSDGSGGAIVAWVDLRSGTADIYAQRVDMTGAILWGITARTICTAAQAQTGVRVVSDGAGGAIIAWVDGRSGGSDVYAQRVNAAGTAQWTANGVPMCVAAGDQSGLVLEPNGSGGAWLAWVDGRNGQDIYMNQVTGTGVAFYGDQGTGVSLHDGAQSNLRSASSGTAFYLAWEDRGGTNSNVWAYVFDFVGGTTLGPLAVCTAPGDQVAPAIAADGHGGATVAWQDYRVSATRPQVYAQRVRANGERAFPDSDRPRVLSVRDVPNDQGGRVSLRFTGGRLDNLMDRSVSLLRVWRRVAPSAAVMAGASLEGADPGAMRGRFLARRSGAEASATTYWEAVASLPAEHLAGYAYTAETTQDSIAGSNPYTAFFVTALTTDPYTYYQSDVDSAYSVDNLAPVMPQAFVGQPVGGSIALHWAKSTEPDFAVYRVHRGGSPDFAMNPGNLVTEQADTGYVDTPSGAEAAARGDATTPEAGGPWYYKLVALDTHGNASAAALLAPQQTNAVSGPAAGRLWLANASPNPVRRQATIAYSLPREGDVSLELFDVRGARVRKLASGRQAAGDHAVRWDGRDHEGARLASGVYFCRLVTEEGSMSRRLVLAD